MHTYTHISVCVFVCVRKPITYSFYSLRMTSSKHRDRQTPVCGDGSKRSDNTPEKQLAPNDEL